MLLKDELLLELIRGVIIWNVWLERNILILQGVTGKSKAVEDLKDSTVYQIGVI